jgi:hypothetical protein
LHPVVLAITDEAIERGLTLLRCMSPEVAPFGHGAMSDLSPLSGAKRKTSARAEYFAFWHEPDIASGGHSPAA